MESYCEGGSSNFIVRAFHLIVDESSCNRGINQELCLAMKQINRHNEAVAVYYRIIDLPRFPIT